jgi:hypothetical protein
LFNMLGYKPMVNVNAVGGLKVRGGAAGRRDLLAVQPGFVELEVVYAIAAKRKSIAFSFETKVADIYEIQFAGESPSSVPIKYVDVWITNLTTGISVTPETRILLVP